jgi:branched-chain amino acid transport system ATP-binding protein
MNAEETEDMVRFILYINRVRKLTTVMIEHDMGVVMDISDRVAVLDFGEKIAEGSPAEVQHNLSVIKAYLGEEFEVA